MSPAFWFLTVIMLQLLSDWKEVFVTGHCCRPAQHPNPGNAFPSFSWLQFLLFDTNQAFGSAGRNASRRSFRMPSEACRNLQHTGSRGVAKGRSALAFQ